jgi:hypothetical protein
MRATLDLRTAERTNLKTSETDRYNTATVAVRFGPEHGEHLIVAFFPGGEIMDPIVCGTWYGNSQNWAAMNNLKNYGHGPGQSVTWATCDSGVMLAARYFMDQKRDCDEQDARQQRREKRERREARERRTRELFPNGLKGGTGDKPGPLFKLPAA